MPVEIKNDRLDQITKALQDLASNELLVGVPASTAPRDDGGDVNNAVLAYVHNYGEPAHNIPARPFIEPAINNRRDRAIELMKKAGELALDGKGHSAVSKLHQLGMEIQTEMKEIISRGIAPPIQDKTVKNRWRQRGKGAQMRPAEIKYFEERAKGKMPGELQTQNGVYGLITPLINTGALLGALRYVVRKR